MKSYFLKFSCLFFVVVALSACSNTNDTVVTSSTNPRISSFSLAGNDSITKAAFKINADSITIENVDSLPFGTLINKAIPKLTFVSSVGALYYLNGSTTGKLVTGKDTVDFNSPVKIKNTASDNSTIKEYNIKVNVHKVEPKLYVWSLLNNIVGASNPTSQKAIYFNSKLLYYSNEAGTIHLYTSTAGATWAEATTLSGLPANATMANMVQFNGKLHYTQNGVKIYSSTDGVSWTSVDFTSENYTFKTLLFSLNGNIWAITQSKVDQKYRFASSVNGSTWLIKNELPANFPITDFAALSFTSRVGSRPKAIIIGGKDKLGNVLNTNWNTEDGTYWVDFNENSGHSKSLDTLALGASLVAYDSKLLVFGTKKDDNTTQYKVSLDEGLTWKATDNKYNSLPVSFQFRNYSSVVLNNSNRIYIIGGKTNTTIFSDVWTGKLNSLSFIKQ